MLKRFVQFTRAMSSVSLQLLHPPKVEYTGSIDRSKFVVKANVWTVLFKEPKSIGLFLKPYKDESLRIPRVSAIIDLSPSDVPDAVKDDQLHNKKLKAVGLTQKLPVTDLDEKHRGEIDYKPEQLDKYITKECQRLITANNGIYLIHELTFDYDYWSADDILKSVLPPGLDEDPPNSFTVTGHIAHLNLKDEYKPYAPIIGEIILDKSPSIKTVVDKVNSIETKYRTFPMKVIAGEDNFMVTQHESDCEFHFDFKTVYWNSRLSTEHDRLIQGFETGTAICDAMAGVGPFAIPAAKKGCIAFANDLNPESYKYLKENITRNKVNSLVIPYNVDGADFIKQSPKILLDYAQEHIKTKDSVQGHGKKKRKVQGIKIPHFFSDYVMNLPGSAIEFIPAYVGLFTNAFPDKSRDEVKQIPGYKLPLVHLYHFEKYSPTEEPLPTSEDLYMRVHKKLCGYLKYKIPFESLQFHLVRKVAPTKPMYCVTFELPEEVAFAV